MTSVGWSKHSCSARNREATDMRLSDINSTVADVDLGGMDAESDPDLSGYFLTTAHVDAAYNGKAHIFLGRKGSGKSSIFSQMPRLVSDYRNGAHILLLNPDAYAWRTLRAYSENGISSELAHANAWRFTLALELGLYLIGADLELSSDAKRGLRKFQEFVGANFGRDSSGSLKATSGALKSLDSFNLSAFGFAAGASRRTPERLELTPDVTNAMFEALDTALHEQPVIVAFDRLDDAWDGSPESRSLLIGLLKASKETNDGYRAPRGTKPILRVVIFLRTDIYDSLSFDDKDKHRPFEQQITWDEEELRDLISRRLPDHVSVDELFEDGWMRGSVRPFDHILKRTFLRPREVLQFVDLCLKTSKSDAREVTKEVIKEAENRFSSWKVEDLKQEYSKSTPSLPKLVEALRQQVHRYDSFDELIATLKSREATLVEQLGEREVLQILFDASVLGIRVSGAGATRFKATSPELTLPTAGVVYVHQGLYKGLNLTETRKSRDSEAEAPYPEDS